MQITLRTEIEAAFQLVAREHDMQLAPLSDSLELLDSGLDSLCFAVVVARLEGQLGLDPFSTSEDVLFPATFGEFVRLYENTAK
jgi:acyl carrier protein